MAGSLTREEIQEIFAKYPQYSKVDTFVETGTFRAETTLCMCKLFPHTYTIELSEELYRQAREKLKETSAVCCHGDSVQVLPELLGIIKQPAIYFLDAHWCKRESAKGPIAVPLLQELELIAQRSFSDLVIVDDVRLFATSRSENWGDISVTSILKSLSRKVPAWKRILRLGYTIMHDRMIIPL